jgi:hypothetical protein
MEQKSIFKERYRELSPSKNGRFTAEWALTDTRINDTVKLTLPPIYSIPIIFVPGIMGSNLCNLKNESVWLLNGVKNIPVSLAMMWSRKGAGYRQVVLHPEKTKVYSQGAVPKGNSRPGITEQIYLQRGWGEISEASYHEFLLWLDEKLNGDRNPLNWTDFSGPPDGRGSNVDGQIEKKLLPGLVMKMEELPEFAEKQVRVDSITSDELIKRSKVNFPIYAFGYNWLASNKDAASLLKKKIKQVIRENNVGVSKCSKVILVTHSMGGLVARACCQLPDVSQDVLGIVHGVMPATGAAVAYRRCKVGMADEDRIAGLVIGSDGKEVTAVFAQSPGALQLLPSGDYGKNWLEIRDPEGRLMSALPSSDPYTEIYLEREKWWGLISEDWLQPEEGKSIEWDIYARNIKLAKEFHRGICKKYHHKTFVFYGGGSEKGSYSKIRWNIKSGKLSHRGRKVPSMNEILNFGYKRIKADGSNNIFVSEDDSRILGHSSENPTIETSYWHMQCQAQDSTGDGTVPANSGRDPREGGGENILQQFEVAGIKHESAYRNPVARKITHYAIIKLAAMADLS